MRVYPEQFAAATYLDHALRVHDFLARQSDLSPHNPWVSTTLTAFVRDTMRPRSAAQVTAILAAPALQEIAPDLRRLLGRAEYEMECYCAHAMTGAIKNAESRFSSYTNFIYRDNYAALIANELRLMKRHGKMPPLRPDRESIAVVGAGPLPISAIMYHQGTGFPVTCIDSDARACALGRNLVRHLAATVPRLAGIDRKIHYLHKTGEEHDYVTHPIVSIASLVTNKAPVIMRIIKTSHTVATTIVRSTEGLGTLLYKPENSTGGQESYNIYLTGQTRPTPQTINTSLVYRFPAGKFRIRNKIEWEALPDDLQHIRPRPYRLWRTRPQDHL
ncbi:MAG: nicotianamine synthase family protein [Alphaproteobacteria bacterium]